MIQYDKPPHWERIDHTRLSVQNLEQSKEWDPVKLLLAEDFESFWPQSYEKFNRDNFINGQKLVSLLNE